MNRTLILLIGLAALASPAAAGDIAVPILGRDDAAVKADIRKAAQKVCRDVTNGSIMSVWTERPCIKQVVAKAEADLTQARLANAQANARYAAAK